jgi:hypothetical protein
MAIGSLPTREEVAEVSTADQDGRRVIDQAERRVIDQANTRVVQKS